MCRRSVFCVQAYTRDEGGLHPGARRQFTSACEAEEVAARLSRYVAGVMVYGVEGDPDVEHWGEEAVFARHGDVPAIEF
jgi:hypothetical protein